MPGNASNAATAAPASTPRAPSKSSCLPLGLLGAEGHPHQRRPVSAMYSASGRTNEPKPFLAAVVARGRQRFDHAGVRVTNGRAAAGDPVAGCGLEAGVAEVDEHDADLAPVVGVDQPRPFTREIPCCAASPERRHEPGDPGRQRDRHTGGDRHALARPQREALGRAQVVAGVAGAGARRYARARRTKRTCSWSSAVSRAIARH